MENGRLGNQLWQIASTIGIAESNGCRATFRPDWEYRPFFSVPDSYFEAIPAGQPRHDMGTEYLQELRYWSHIENQIHLIFAPSSAARTRVQEVTLPSERENLVSVHIRRGDYLKYPSHFIMPSKTYYRKAMAQMREENSNSAFLIFSDDISWCQANLGAPDATFIQGISRPVEMRDRRRQQPLDYIDLFLMTLCSRHIIANSTFSWWGAVLAKSQRVIYPSRWYGPALDNIEWHSMIPDEWEALSSC